MKDLKSMKNRTSGGPDLLAMPNELTTREETEVARSARRRGWRWVWVAVVILLMGVGVCLVVRGLTVRRVIASSGGIYFVREVALGVPGFRQGDPRWHADLLGSTADDLGAVGCALTSAAMVLKWYGVDTDPQRLNDYLTKHKGYEGNGYIIWERAAKVSNGGVKKAYEDLPSYWRIDSQLMKGNPVIVRIHLAGGSMHFVVIAGKRGFDYLILDPGAGWNRGLYPLREITQRIEGLRYYRRVRREG
jgi:Peptidase_C39 like family